MGIRERGAMAAQDKTRTKSVSILAALTLGAIAVQDKNTEVLDLEIEECANPLLLT